MRAGTFTRTVQVYSLGLGQKRKALGLCAAVEKSEAALMKLSHPRKRTLGAQHRWSAIILEPWVHWEWVLGT